MRQVLFHGYAIAEDKPKKLSSALRRILRMANDLANLFPYLRCLRLIMIAGDSTRLDDLCDQSKPVNQQIRSRATRVATAERQIRAYLSKHPSRTIPIQLELVEDTSRTFHTSIEDTPFCEAFRNVRDSQLSRTTASTMTTVAIETKVTAPTPSTKGLKTTITTTTTRTVVTTTTEA